MKKRYVIFLCFILLLAMINVINIYNINKQKGYYIGRIESLDKKDAKTIVKVSPVSSNRYFIQELKANHQIEYDKINIAGLSDPRKNSRRLKLGELGEIVQNLKAGDTIIFKVNDNYGSDNYNLEIKELAVDLTLE